MLRFSLRDAGFRVEAVATGGAALDRMERDSPDAVILDLGLPDGYGPAVLDRLRRMDHEREAHHPAWVVITAQDPDEVAHEFGPLGKRFLPKPFNPWDLVRMLKALLP